MQPEIILASEYIHQNRRSIYIGRKGNFSYYNIKGVVWEVWQDGCGNYPTSTGIKIENFDKTKLENYELLFLSIQ